jgi:hypothetical protein
MGAGNQMTRDDVIRFTREAGGFDITPEFLDRFANLVAAAEREALAKYFGHIEVRVDDKWVWLDEFIRARGEK